MKIRDILNKDTATISFEVFPPKKSTDFGNVEAAALAIAALQPAYMSVTYGAGGSTKGHTIALAGEIQKKHNVPTVAHLTCVCADRSSIGAALTEMQAAGIENILALRGDIPKDFDGEVFTDFTHASDLTTQMFFDNNIFFNFMYRVREAGITVPIVPGIMPITRGVQVKNAVKLSGCNVPERFKNIVDRFGDNPEAMKQAGIAYATDQIIDLLANGVKHIHVYSMNKPDVAAGIQRNISEILKA